MLALRGRHQGWQRMPMSSLLVISALVITLLYIYLFQMGEMYGNNNPPAGERCISELANVKYQLESVSEYKKKMDVLLIELQQDCNVHKEHVKDLANSYALVKNHLEICELQTEELEFECTELKAKLLKTNQELETCKKPPVKLP